MNHQPNRPGPTGDIAPLSGSSPELAPAEQPPGTPKTRAKLSGKQIGAAVAVGLVAVLGVIGLVWWRFNPSGHDAWADWVRSIILGLGFIGAVPAGYIAYRKQVSTEADHQLDRDKYDLEITKEERRQQERDDSNRRAGAKEYRDRFVTVTAQLGSDRAAIRLAGVHALAQLGDEWGETEPQQRQTCVDVLCAYMGVPHGQEAGDLLAEPPGLGPTLPVGEARVRAQVLNVIGHRLSLLSAPGREQAPIWSYNRIDLSNAVIGDFSWRRIKSHGDGVILDNCSVLGRFSLDYSRLTVLSLRDALLDSAAEFSVLRITRILDLTRAHFNGSVTMRHVSCLGDVCWSGAIFTGPLDMRHGRFKSDHVIDGSGATYGWVSFREAQFEGKVSFLGSRFAGQADFRKVQMGGAVDFTRCSFVTSAGFCDATFGSACSFAMAAFGSETFDFTGAKFSEAPTMQGAHITGALIHPDGTVEAATIEPRAFNLQWQLPDAPDPGRAESGNDSG